MRAPLRVFDQDGDGTVAPMELARGAELYLESKKMVKKLTRLAVALLLLMGIMLAAITGLVFTVVELSKETKIEGGVTLDKTTGLPTASAGLSDASGVSRTADNKTASAAVNAVPADLTSSLPDEAFDQMRYLRVENEQAKLVLQIHGWARFYEGDGSTVVLMTHAGECRITGRQLSFSSDVSPVFEQAGFTVDASGRRLLSLYSLVGLFNNIDSFEGLDENAQLPSFPDKFYVEYDMFYACYQTGADATGADRCDGLDLSHAEEGATFNNLAVTADAQPAQSNYILAVRGKMWYDNGKAVEVKESVLRKDAYDSVTFFNPGGEGAEDDHKGSWMFDASTTTELGRSYVPPASDVPADHPEFPGVVMCEQSYGEESEVGMGEVLAMHMDGYFDGEVEVVEGSYGLGGKTVRKFRLEGDETIKYMTAYLFDEKMSDGTYLPRRVSNQLDGEGTVFILKCFNDECEGVDPDWSIADEDLELPQGCSAPEAVLKASPSVELFAGSNPFPPGAIGDPNSASTRKLFAKIMDDRRRVAEGTVSADSRRSLLSAEHHLGRDLAALAGMGDIEADALLTEDGIRFELPNPVKADSKVLTAPLEDLAMYGRHNDGRHLLGAATKFKQLWQAAGSSKAQVQLSANDRPGNCQSVYLQGVPVGAVSYLVGFNPEPGKQGTYCLLAIEGELQFGMISVTLSFIIDVDKTNGFAGNFEIAGKVTFAVGVYGVGIPFAEGSIVGGQQVKGSHPCMQKGVCNGDTNVATVGYAGLVAKVNVVAVWGTLYYYVYPSQTIDDRTHYLLKGDVNVGINVGFFSVGAQVFNNADNPVMWWEDNDGNSDTYSGKKLNLGDRCGWNDNQACFTGVCCACYYGMGVGSDGASTQAGDICDTHESWWGYCEGEYSKAQGGNPSC